MLLSLFFTQALFMIIIFINRAAVSGTAGLNLSVQRTESFLLLQKYKIWYAPHLHEKLYYMLGNMMKWRSIRALSLSLSLRCLISSYPQQKHPASSSSSGCICHTRCPRWLLDPQEQANQWSTTTSWCLYPKRDTHPTASTSPPGPQPIRRKISSCPNWTAGAKACLDHRWARNASSMWVRKSLVQTRCKIQLPLNI